MTLEHKNQLFRLATVLYADNNYEVTPKTIHRKIIESSLLDNDNKQMTIHEIIDYIGENYHFTFDEEEIKSIINNPKETGFSVGKDKAFEYLICLTEQRKQTLISKVNKQNIDYFIEEFIKLNENTNELIDAKGLLYKFLYDLINTNISGFSKLLNSKKVLTELINVEQSQFNELEREVINSFLSWDNDGKNKAIFDIASYGIEYCLITNNAENSIHLSSLKNKVFYLDTNVIFRALGINGENRQKRTLSFLSKFNDAGETILISRFSELEFKATVKYYVAQIAKHNSPRINPKIFTSFIAQSDFFDFYHKWRVNRMNTSLEYFESHIIVLFEEFIAKFKSSIDYIIPFDEKDEKNIKILNDVANNIHSFKTSQGATNGYETSIWDAKNIHLIERKRDGKNANLVETKFFFLSTDQGLRRWDFQRSIGTPIILLPSQWMSILLRYVNRTSDDFKSFVSFLNMPQGEKEVTYEKLQLILTGISEITEDADKQSNLIKILVEKKFKDVIQKGFSNEDIVEQSKSFAKTELEKDLGELSEKHNVLENKFESHKATSEVKIEDLESKSDIQKISLKSKNKEIDNLKTELKNKTVKEELKKWQKPAIFLIPLALLIVIFTTLQFCCYDWDYNYSYQIIRNIDLLESDSQKNTLRGLMYTPIIGFGLIASFCYKRLFNNDEIDEKKKELAIKFDEKYK